MTTPFEAEDAIVKRWIANWSSTNKTFLLGEKSKPTAGSAYIELEVVHDTGGGQDTLGPIGNRRFLRKASVILRIFTPADAGTSLRNTLAHAARAIFEGESFGGMNFFGANGPIPAGNDGEWLKAAVTCPFDYTEIK